MSTRHTQSVEELIAAQKPGYALDQRFYTDDDVYELELERVVNRSWIFAGHESEVAEPGDFKLFSIARESAIIVRGDDGVIKAFANVCRHRGSRVCLEKNGHVDKFSCPYHGWIYDRNGQLTAARNMAGDFDKSAHGLKPVSFATLQGLMFVAFSDAPASMANCERDLEAPMKLFDMQNLKVAAYREYAIPANYKLSTENYLECYHCATAHPDYARLHTLMLDDKKRKRVQQHMLDKMPACGLPEIEFRFSENRSRPGEMGYAYSRTALFEGYQTGSKDGAPLAPLLGNLKDYDGGASDFTLGPFSFMLAYSDHIVAYVFTPVDRENSKCEIYWLVRGDAEQGTDYDVDALVWLWDITTEADKNIIVNNSEGVNSSYYEPGPFSAMEEDERSFTEWLLRELARP
jgi:Rieske 2Fe-2S family protein